MIKNLIFYLKKETFLILLYGLAPASNVLFLLLAYKLNFLYINDYIIAVATVSIIASVFYSLVIKSVKYKNKIKLQIKSGGLKSILIIFSFLLLYLISMRVSIIFFLSLVLSEFLINLVLTKYQKENKSYKHALVKNFQSLLRLSTLFLVFYTNDIILIGTVYNFTIIILFGSIIKKINFIFSNKKNYFGFYDTLYTLTGSMIFQLDKIIGPVYLDIKVITKYFIIFKVSSIYQILGSVLSQHTRNLLIRKKFIDVRMNKNIKVFIFLLLSLLIFTNLILIILQKYELNFRTIVNIKIEDIIVYNLFSLSFILHTYNGFNIDRLYLNGQALYLTKLSIICLIIISSAIYFYKDPILWSLTILISQILLSLLTHKTVSTLK